MMANVYQGQLNGKGLKVGIAVSRFNEAITGALLNGALGCLERGSHGILAAAQGLGQTMLA